MSEIKSERVTVRLEGELLEYYEKLAKSNKFSLSQQIRVALEYAATNSIKIPFMGKIR